MGTWYNGKSANDYDLKYVFNADGTGKGYKGYRDTWDIVYRYEETTGILTIIEAGEGDIDSYLVEFINNDTFVTYEIHDDRVDRENPEVFKRVKLKSIKQPIHKRQNGSHVILPFVCYVRNNVDMIAKIVYQNSCHRNDYLY